MDKNLYKKYRAIPISVLLRDERDEEKLQHRKTELVLKRSTVEDKMSLAAQMSLNTGHWFERIHEFPDRPETFSDRLLYPLPLNSSDVWVLRSKLDDSSEHLQPRRNFNLDIFGEFIYTCFVQ